MSDKGGKKEERLISLKMVLTAVIGVLIGAIFVLTLIFTGVIVGQRYREARIIHTQKEKVSDVVGVSYKTKSYSYYPAIDGYGYGASYRTLLDMLGSAKDFYLIQSQSEYEKVANTVMSWGGSITTKDFDLPEDFFYSGSIIMITAERRGLSYFAVNSVTRDEDYNLRIDYSVADAHDTEDVSGQLILIAIPNIQPGEVDLVRRTE